MINSPGNELPEEIRKSLDRNLKKLEAETNTRNLEALIMQLENLFSQKEEATKKWLLEKLENDTYSKFRRIQYLVERIPVVESLNTPLGTPNVDEAKLATLSNRLKRLDPDVPVIELIDNMGLDLRDDQILQDVQEIPLEQEAKPAIKLSKQEVQAGIAEELDNDLNNLSNEPDIAKLSALIDKLDDYIQSHPEAAKQWLQQVSKGNKTNVASIEDVMDEMRPREELSVPLAEASPIRALSYRLKMIKAELPGPGPSIENEKPKGQQPPPKPLKGRRGLNRQREKAKQKNRNEVVSTTTIASPEVINKVNKAFEQKLRVAKNQHDSDVEENKQWKLTSIGDQAQSTQIKMSAYTDQGVTSMTVDMTDKFKISINRTDTPAAKEMMQAVVSSYVAAHQEQAPQAPKPEFNIRAKSFEAAQALYNSLEGQDVTIQKVIIHDQGGVNEMTLQEFEAKLREKQENIAQLELAEPKPNKPKGGGKH